MGNIITLPGRLGRDAEVRQTANGTSFLSFSLAVDERTGRQNETRTDWYTVSSFLPNHVGALAQHLKKGQPLLVTGNLRPSIYVGRDGQSHIDLNVTASQIEFLNFGKRDDNGQQQASTAAAPAPAAQAPMAAAPAPAPAPSFMEPHPAAPVADADPSDDLPF